MFALSVNPEVLDAFIRLQTQLRVAGEESEEKNLAFIEFMNGRIDEQVQNEGKMDNIGLRDTLSWVKTETDKMIKELDIHLAEMVKIADWDEDKKDFEAKDQTEENYHYWLGNNEESNGKRGNGKAISLRDALNRYYQDLSEVYNSQVSDSLEKEPRRLKDPEYGLTDARKSWEQKTWEGPVVANMATLEALKLEVWQEEKNLLDILSVRLGAPTPFQPDTIMPFSAPISTIVPAGMPFQTHLLIGMASTNMKPGFSSPNGSVQLEQGGNMALLTVTADGRHIPAGANEGTQPYTARIQVPKATGGEQTLEYRGSFTVRKPELIFRSEAVQLLYKECANPLSIDAPALGEYYRPSVKARGGSVTPSSSNPKKFRIVPTATPCTIEVSSTYNGQTTQLGKVPYRVILPPKPEVEFKVNGRKAVGIPTVPKASRIRVSVIPDREFMQQFPKDARYVAEKIEVLASLGIGPPRVVKTINVQGKNLNEGVTFSFPPQVRQMSRGMKVFVRIEGIARVNFQGKRIKEKRISSYESTASFTLR